MSKSTSLMGEAQPGMKAVKNKHAALIAERKRVAKQLLDSKKKPKPEPQVSESERKAAYVTQKYEKTRDSFVQGKQVSRSASRKAKYAMEPPPE